MKSNYFFSPEKFKNKQKDLLRLSGFLFSLILFSVIAGLLVKNEIIPWPFRRTLNLRTTYLNIMVYIPVFLFAIFSLFWLKQGKQKIMEAFKWAKPGFAFYLVLIISAGYSIYLFTFHSFPLLGPSFWPAVIILSILNAFAEELAYRLVLTSLLKELMKKKMAVILIQSLAYALPHFFIAGFKLALFAFIYGIMLGYVNEKEKSITPCIICHFSIDIGSIGLPLLINLPFK